MVLEGPRHPQRRRRGKDHRHDAGHRAPGGRRRRAAPRAGTQPDARLSVSRSQLVHEAEVPERLSMLQPQDVKPFLLDLTRSVNRSMGRFLRQSPHGVRAATPSVACPGSTSARARERLCGCRSEPGCVRAITRGHAEAASPRRRARPCRPAGPPRANRSRSRLQQQLQGPTGVAFPLSRSKTSNSSSNTADTRIERCRYLTGSISNRYASSRLARRPANWRT